MGYVDPSETSKSELITQKYKSKADVFQILNEQILIHQPIKP